MSNILRDFSPVNLLKLKNRGLLLDVVVFVLNLFLMSELSSRFFGIVKNAAAGDSFSRGIIFLFFVSLLFLAPAGAIFKRWHFHERRKLEGKDAGEIEGLGGCLFNPIFYFCLSVVIFSVANAFLLEFFSKGKEPNGTVFVSMILGGFVMIIITTVIVYRYFSPPQREPRWAFLRSRNSETLGDIFIFLNMVFFQILWNGLMSSSSVPVDSIGEFAARLFFIIFCSFLVYFPPRIFYLYEDINKGRTWLMILLANAPLIYRVMAGGG